MLRILSCVALLLVGGCSDNLIPDQDIKISPRLLTKLEQLNAVELMRNPVMYTTKCRFFEAGETGYYLISDNNSLNDDYAKWKCASELKYHKCPDFNVTPRNGLASVHVTRGSTEDYSIHDLERCIVNAIEYAPEESIPTSEEVSNRDSWSVNSNN